MKTNRKLLVDIKATKYHILQTIMIRAEEGKSKREKTSVLTPEYKKSAGTTRAEN